jgi:glycosyltransferase involved in cell wall biosynthesis
MSFKPSPFPKRPSVTADMLKKDVGYLGRVSFENSTANVRDFERSGLRDINLAEKFNFISPQPNIAIFLSTYEGQNFLADQLDSILNQNYSKWKIYARDDCSTDNTFSILQRFHKTHLSKIDIKSNQKNSGFISNFLSMVCDQTIQADLYAYADQDDVWEEDKLQRAVEWISKIPKERPALYCSRTITVNENNVAEGYSPLFSRKPSFANAIVQSIGGGNTMVFNKAARDLIAAAGADVKIASHDWWSYILVSGCGGEVFYDTHPSIRYRQHSNNFIGTNNSVMARLSRVCMLFQNRFKNWNQDHIDSLSKISHRLTKENLKTLGDFTQARDGTLPQRLLKLKRSNVYRQTLLGNIGLVAACILKKL